MTKVVINLCGVKSKGGVTVVNNYLKQNNTKNLYVIYDNLEFKKYIDNFDNQYITTKRFYHPFLNILLNKNIKEKINTCDYIIHFGNFGFKTKIKSYTLVQNILPLVKPFSSFRNFALNILRKLIKNSCKIHRLVFHQFCKVCHGFHILRRFLRA